MPQAKINDLELNYSIAGTGDPLLMIMGLGASSAAWDPALLEELARHFRVIAFDNRGTGQSDKPDIEYSLPMFADDAAGLLKHLGIPRAHIFGVSMGGMIAQEFALTHAAAVHSLVLGCTTAGGHNAVQAPPESLAVLTAPRDGVPPDEIIRRGWPLVYTRAYIESHRAELEAIIARLLAHPTPPFAFKRQFDATLKLNNWDRLLEVKAPTLVITGAEDCLIPAKNSELIASRIPGARLHIIPGVGHGFMVARKEFLGVFVPFLKEHALVA